MSKATDAPAGLRQAWGQHAGCPQPPRAGAPRPESPLGDRSVCSRPLALRSDTCKVAAYRSRHLDSVACAQSSRLYCPHCPVIIFWVVSTPPGFTDASRRFQPQSHHCVGTKEQLRLSRLSPHKTRRWVPRGSHKRPPAHPSPSTEAGSMEG